MGLVNHNGKSSIDLWNMVDGPTENPWRWNCGIVGRIPELNEWRVLAWDHPRTKWRIFGSKPWLNVPLNDGFMWVLFLTKFDFTDWRVSYKSFSGINSPIKCQNNLNTKCTCYAPSSKICDMSDEIVMSKKTSHQLMSKLHIEAQRLPSGK